MMSRKRYLGNQKDIEKSLRFWGISIQDIAEMTTNLGRRAQELNAKEVLAYLRAKKIDKGAIEYKYATNFDKFLSNWKLSIRSPVPAFLRAIQERGEEVFSESSITDFYENGVNDRVIFDQSRIFMLAWDGPNAIANPIVKWEFAVKNVPFDQYTMVRDGRNDWDESEIFVNGCRTTIPGKYLKMALALIEPDPVTVSISNRSPLMLRGRGLSCYIGPRCEEEKESDNNELDDLVEELDELTDGEEP